MLYVLFTFREIDCRGGLALAANVECDLQPDCEVDDLHNWFYF